MLLGEGMDRSEFGNLLMREGKSRSPFRLTPIGHTLSVIAV